MKYNINKSALIEEAVNGAWDRSMHAKQQHLLNMDKHMSQNYDQNAGHYFLNPFVSGPLSHGMVKFRRASNGVEYEILKNSQSDNLSNKPTVVADVSKGPVNADMDLMSASLTEYQNALSNVRERNPVQYMYNPFVPGPLNNAVLDAANTANGATRVIISPTTKKGDTLVKAPSGYMK